MHSALPELTNDVPGCRCPGLGSGFHLLLEDIPAMRRAGTGSTGRGCSTASSGSTAPPASAAVFMQLLPFFDARTVQRMLELNGAVFGGVEGS